MEKSDGMMRDCRKEYEVWIRSEAILCDRSMLTEASEEMISTMKVVTDSKIDT